MTHFHIEATWRDGGVDVECYRIEPLTPEHAARLVEVGMLKPTDEKLTQVKVGEFVVPYPDGGFPKRVRRAALDWLAEHAGYTHADTFELQMWTGEVKETLARLEAAAAAAQAT